MLGSSALRYPFAAVLILTLAQFGSPPTSQAQTNRNVELLANMHRYPEYRGVWPYVHPDGREYAVLMTSEGASFVSLADPRNPVEVGLITSHYPYAEVRTYGRYVYMVTQDSRDVTADPSDAGLAIVDQGISAHGGSIVARSNAAEGTLFEFLIPRSERATH